MESTKTMEALNASAESANEAAETALLATESIIALSSKVSDDVRSAVQEAIEAATPPVSETPAATIDSDNSALIDELRGAVQQAIESTSPASAPAAELDSGALIDELSKTVQEAVKSATPKPSVMDAVLNPEEEEKKSPLEHAPLIAGALTLCGVGYLAMQNIEFSSDLTDQYQKLTLIEEQLQSNVDESGSQVMLLAEQNQHIKEAIKALSATPTEADTAESVTPEKSSEMVALDQLSGQISALQQTLEQIQTTTASVEEATRAGNTATPAQPATETVTSSDITLEGIRTTLQQELVPLHTSIKLVKQQLNKPAISIPTQPLQPTEREAIRFEKKPNERSRKDKPRVYRYP